MRTNIIRITAFILALAIILVCGASLFAGTPRESSQGEQLEAEEPAEAHAAASARHGGVKSAVYPDPEGETAKTAAYFGTPQTVYTAKERIQDKLPSAQDKTSAGETGQSQKDAGYITDGPADAGKDTPNPTGRNSKTSETPDASDEMSETAPTLPSIAETSDAPAGDAENSTSVPTNGAALDTTADVAPGEDAEQPDDTSEGEEGRYDALTLSDDDLELLARLVYLEARGEPYDGQVAVAEVVLNRVLSDRFPDTVEEVVYQTGQFTPASYLESTSPGEEQYEAVADAVDGETYVTGEDVVFFSGAPYNDRVYAVIGNHYFCEL